MQRSPNCWCYNIRLLRPEECFSQLPDLGLHLHFSIMLGSVSFFSSSGFVVNGISPLSVTAVWGSSHQQWVLIFNSAHKFIHSFLPFLFHPFIYPSICLSFYSTNISVRLLGCQALFIKCSNESDMAIPFWSQYCTGGSEACV